MSGRQTVSVPLEHHEIQRLRMLLTGGPQVAEDRELYLKLVNAEERHERKYP